MRLKQCIVMCATSVIVLFLVGKTHAQLSPGIQQSGPVQLDPKAQQRQDLQRQLDRRPPGIPTLIAPTEKAILQIPDNQPARVLFRWQAGPGAPIDRYKLCLFEATKTCELAGREIYTISGTAQQFDSFQGLPKAKFMGRSLKWSVAACRDVLMLASPETPQPFTKEICVSSSAQMLYWPLPPPRPGAYGRGEDAQPGVPTYHFNWSTVPAAKAYLFCLFDGRINQCIDRTTLPDSNPLIVDKGGTSYTINYDLTQFRKKTVRWTVAACTHWRPEQAPSSPLPDEFRCTWQQDTRFVPTIHIANPVVAPSYNIREIRGEEYSPDSPQPIEMKWILNRAQNVESVKLCVLTAQGPGGIPVPEAGRRSVLSATSPESCNHRNVIVNPDRNRTLDSCIFQRPLLRTGSDSSTVFGFAVAACNELKECAWSSPLVIIQEYEQITLGGRSYKFGTHAICADN